MTAFGESCRRGGHHLPALYDPKQQNLRELGFTRTDRLHWFCADGPSPTEWLSQHGNAALGGDGWKTAFFCTRTSLGSFSVKIPGVPVPAVKKS
jgi:hypothetical protein